jgi:hypothetical protein
MFSPLIVPGMDPLTTSPAVVASASASASAPGVSANGVPANSPPGKVRAACNRCHAQKLRCVRKADQAKCERCRKLHTSCKFSPRAPRSSLKQGEPAIDGGMQASFPSSQSGDVPNIHVNSMVGDCNDSGWLFSQTEAIDVASGSQKCPKRGSSITGHRHKYVPRPLLSNTRRVFRYAQSALVKPFVACRYELARCLRIS